MNLNCGVVVGDGAVAAVALTLVAGRVGLRHPGGAALGGTVASYESAGCVCGR